LSHDLDQAFEILKKKQEDYTAYQFKAKETMAIFAFFDLAQEFATISNLYRTAVAVIKFFFGYESCIYTIRPADEALMLQCCTTEGLLDPPIPARADIVIHQSPYRAGSSSVFPIIGKKALVDKVPLFLDDQILGMLEIYPVKRMSNHRSLFFQKYANRVGYNMHNKLVVEQNIEHIQFINQIVSDIEHNVILPNLYYKAFLINMNKDLKKNSLLLEDLRSLASRNQPANRVSGEDLTRSVDEFRSIHEDMTKKMKDFETHFKHLSLFIETLFRSDHFRAGGYVLKRRHYNLVNEVFIPELEHYRKRLAHRNIEILEPPSLPTEEALTIFVDMGLTAQVFANLLSNALKYCEPILDKHGNPRRYISYQAELVTMESPEPRDALKVSLFNTGKAISPKDALLIFEDGYKIAEHQDKNGSGHGLHFVKNITQLHGGYAGCTPERNGNIFYIVLPRVSPEDRAARST
jgi:signal transduction histidine kinase